MFKEFFDFYLLTQSIFVGDRPRSIMHGSRDPLGYHYRFLAMKKSLIVTGYKVLYYFNILISTKNESQGENISFKLERDIRIS